MVKVFRIPELQLRVTSLKGISIKLTQPEELSFSTLETFLAEGPGGKYEKLEEENLVLWIFYLFDNRIESVIQLTVKYLLNGFSGIKALSYIYLKILIVLLISCRGLGSKVPRQTRLSALQTLSPQGVLGIKQGY